jgi:hypothetical protein
MTAYELRPCNGPTLRFEGSILGEAHSDLTTVRIYGTAHGYVGEVTQHCAGAPNLVKCWTFKSPERCANALLRNGGGLDRDDPDRVLIRMALDRAGLDSVREV